MPEEIPLSPEQAAALTELLADQEHRLSLLYHILDKDGRSSRFVPNWAQRRLHQSAHSRNNILKVRQLGISTYIALLILDSCLFIPNFKAGIVDKTLDDACAKLQKIKYAYEMLDYLPEEPTEADIELAAIGRMIKAHFATPNFKTHSISFPNGASVVVGASLRGGTLQLLHVSELGYIAAHDPMRANEVITGSLNAVGKNCQVYFESTHEGGKYGVNYEQVLSAMDMIGKPLSPLDFKFYFFPWFEHEEYQLADSSYQRNEEDESYFAGLETRLDISISPPQRAWYSTMKRVQRSKMKQEYPSTPEEALAPIMDGTIYSHQISSLRERGELKAEFEHEPYRPIYTAWDIGIGDYMSIWWIQPNSHGKWLVLDCYTANGKALSHYIEQLRVRDARWGRCASCITPHDGSRKDPTLTSFNDHLRNAGYAVTQIPRTQDIWGSIENTRELLSSCIIHARCSEPSICDGISYIAGVDALANYRTLPAGAHGALKTAPLHDQCSHASDALRAFADGLSRGLLSLYAPREQHAHHRAQQSSFVSAFLN